MERRAFLATSAAALYTLARPWDYLHAKSASRARPPILGLNSHTLHAPDLEHLSRLGITHVRTTGLLQHWESGLWKTYMRELAERAERRGIRLLWVLHNNIGYRRAAFAERLGYVAQPGNGRREGDWMRRIAEFAQWTARLPATDAIQPWNEMDVWHEAPFGGAEGLPPEVAGRAYAEQIRLIGDLPNGVKLVTGATADHPSGRWRGFLRGLAAELPAVDGYAIHAYGPWSRVRTMIAEARSIIGDRPLWLTEFGYGGDEYDPQGHLTAWRTTIEGAEQEQPVERLYGYCLQTDPRRPKHGLLETDGSPRPTYRWLSGQV